MTAVHVIQAFEAVAPFVLMALGMVAYAAIGECWDRFVRGGHW
jgi:lipoprotein signal peptidase